MEPNLINYLRMVPSAVWNMVGEMPFILYLIGLAILVPFTDSFVVAAQYALLFVLPALVYTIWMLFPLRKIFGVRWDRKGRARCPYCASLLITVPTKIAHRRVEPHPTKTNWTTGEPSKVVRTNYTFRITKLRCPGCGMLIELHDDEGNPVEYADAKDQITEMLGR